MPEFGFSSLGYKSLKNRYFIAIDGYFSPIEFLHNKKVDFDGNQMGLLRNMN